MKRGRVVGEVWATRKAPLLAGRRLVLVASEPDNPRSPLVVAIDPLRVGAGDTVLVSFGSGARNALAPPPNPGVLADAAVVQRVDGETDQGG